MNPGNKPNNFVVHLAKPLELSGSWVVGLAELHFPNVFKPHIDPSKLVPAYDVSVVTDPLVPPPARQIRKRRRAEDEEEEEAGQVRKKRRATKLDGDDDDDASQMRKRRRDEEEEEEAGQVRKKRRATKADNDVAANDDDGGTGAPEELRKRATVVKHVFDVDSDDEIEPVLVSDDDLVRFAGNYMASLPIVEINLTEVRRRIESKKEYIFDIIDDMLDYDIAVRQRIPGGEGKVYTSEELARYAGKMFGILGVSEYPREELLTRLKAEENVDDLINEYWDVYHVVTARTPPSTSYMIALRGDNMPVDSVADVPKKKKRKRKLKPKISKIVNQTPPSTVTKKQLEQEKEERRKEEEKEAEKQRELDRIKFKHDSDFKYALNALKKHGVTHINAVDLRQRIENEDVHPDQIVAHMFAKWNNAQVERDTNADYAYALQKLKKMGKKNIDFFDLLKRIELETDVETVIQQVFLDLPFGQALPAPPPPRVRERVPLTVRQRILGTLGKVIMLREEIELRKDHNAEVANGTKTGLLPVPGLSNEMNRTVGYVMQLMGSLGIRHVTEQYLNEQIKEKISKGREPPMLTAREIYTEIEHQQGKRLAYNAYAETVKNCNTLPKYLMVYCDAAQTQPIGDKDGPFLRAIRVTHDTRVTDTARYDKPHYSPVAKTFIHQLEIDIRDERGCPVSFDDGLVIATLHFKRVRE
jgi:hypothetical protein